MKFVIHLHFNGNCEEAIEYYLDIFNGLLLEKIKYEDALIEVEEDKKDLIMYGAISFKNDILYLSDDLRNRGECNSNTNIMVECDTEDEMRNIGEQLGNDGETVTPLRETAWGSIYTVIKDKYGIRWGLNYEKPFE